MGAAQGVGELGMGANGGKGTRGERGLVQQKQACRRAESRRSGRAKMNFLCGGRFQLGSGELQRSCERGWIKMRCNQRCPRRRPSLRV